MKYVKLLFIALFASTVLVACQDEPDGNDFIGKGNAVVEFDAFINRDGDQVFERSISEAGGVIGLPVSYVGSPFKYPFQVEITATILDNPTVSIDDVLLFNTNPVHVLKFGFNYAEDNAAGEKTGTAYFELVPATGLNINMDTTIELTINDPDPSIGATAGTNRKFRIKIMDDVQ
jgi:hypothetical protein